MYMKFLCNSMQYRRRDLPVSKILEIGHKRRLLSDIHKNLIISICVKVQLSIIFHEIMCISSCSSGIIKFAPDADVFQTIVKKCPYHSKTCKSINFSKLRFFFIPIFCFLCIKEHITKRTATMVNFYVIFCPLFKNT